ncbi:Y-family DNA polymerase [Dyadobacter psychrotolerans]|uniref:DNA polymerase Y family protein n=1 Tax=Dyadobacter psychrotolerans TaxID=2541721 RepID=A0A4R5DZF6_9BACT|nr:DNA polymerase Y family protein [Dyadobacter psychrotolerans]TDE18084.1 DNA polymerase Y family protein [Dyadobacter psychrotolerans]
MKRYVSIWFRHLITDRWVIRHPDLKDTAFVLAAPKAGRMVITAASADAEKQGILSGMVVADARAVEPNLQVFEDKPGLAARLLSALAEWCLRYTPIVAVDCDSGLILDITGCAHLWGSERAYMKDITARLRGSGYDVRAAVADTIGAAWAVCHYGRITPLIEPCKQSQAIAPLPPAALRLDAGILERMNKLGFYQIGSFISMPRSILRRRFGQQLLSRLDQALGQLTENILPVCPVEPYQERLPCLEPIRTAPAIEMALSKLLEVLCSRLLKESKGIRKVLFKAFRMDGGVQQIEIGTNSASCNQQHLFRLFQLKVSSLRPDLGFELFILEAPVVEDVEQTQETLWNISGSNDQAEIAELLDRLTGRGGMDIVHRYLPDEHYWPERSIKTATSLLDKPQTKWRTDRPRPVSLLPQPELIQVSAPVPDYPPMLFRYKGQVHKIKKADGPERIEQEWWIQDGLQRDYYCVEDENGARYWIFRLGHYGTNQPEWFIHGFFC